MSKKKLTTYQQKRDFNKTNEPKGTGVPSNDRPIFVVHLHDARSRHYDLRLEDEGVLKSWAIPKGPSTNPADKQLALQTEDHPLEYAQFEGVIPKGQYGTGPVIVWDQGTFKNLKDRPLSECLNNGEATFDLEGQKLKGGYALIKTHYQGKDNAWLLIKMNDEWADRKTSIVEEQPRSVLSGKTIEELG